MDGKPPPKPGPAAAEHRSAAASQPPLTDPVQSPAEITSRIKVDPWTGEVIGAIPPPPNATTFDPEQTNEVFVDPQTGRVLPGQRKVGPRLTPPGGLGQSGQLYEETVEVDTNVYQERLKGDEQSWPAEAMSRPTRDDAAPLQSGSAPPSRPPVPPGVAPYSAPSPPPHLAPSSLASSPQVPTPALMEGVSEAQAWPHMALGRSGTTTDAGVTVGLKMLIAVAVASLAFGATVGSTVTLLLTSNVEPSTTRNEPVLLSTNEPAPQNESESDASTPASVGTSKGGSKAVPISSDAEGASQSKGVEASTTKTDQEIPDVIVLPVTFPEKSAEPRSVDRDKLKQIADLMLHDRSMMVDIVGYAAPSEPSDNAEWLGARRARFVAGIIGGYGPSRTRFKTISGGVSKEYPAKVVLKVRLE